MKLDFDQSLAGILEPVFAIRTESDLGVGDTDGVCQMIDWCHQLGLNVFQTLPINEIGDDNSPYNSISSLAIEPTTICVTPARLPDLPAAVFKKIAAPGLLAELRSGPVNYPKVKALKRKLLEAAFAGFLKKHFGRETKRAFAFQEFLQQNAEWLSDYVLFRVLMEENKNSPAWHRWPGEHQGPRRAWTWLLSLPEKKRELLMRRQLFFAYVQWIAFSQWEAVKAYGEAKKVYLMGDIPFGVSRSSADTWANRLVFDLDWSGGAPPETAFKGDPFTEKWGQNWGVPLYRWDELRRQNFGWWRTRVGNIQKVFHLYRIDHALGLFRIYAFPWTPDRNAEFVRMNETEAADRCGGRLPGFKPFPDDTPEHRAANQAQGEEILRVLQEASGDTTIVAEDLGVVPEYVGPTLQKLNIPGFRIPMFTREHNGAYADPRQYPRLSVAQPATHDHPPLAASWQACWEKIDAQTDVEANQRELRWIMEFAGLPNEEPPREFTRRMRENYIRAVMDSKSWLALFQITDVFGRTERFNTPGITSASNWSNRLAHTVRELKTDRNLWDEAEAFSRLARMANRTH